MSQWTRADRRFCPLCAALLISLFHNILFFSGSVIIQFRIYMQRLVGGNRFLPQHHGLLWLRRGKIKGKGTVDANTFESSLHRHFQRIFLWIAFIIKRHLLAITVTIGAIISEIDPTLLLLIKTMTRRRFSFYGQKSIPSPFLYSPDRPSIIDGKMIGSSVSP